MRRGVILLLALFCTLVPCLTCYAQTTQEQSISSNTTTSATVSVSGISSTFEVMLPKNIVAEINSGDLSVNYAVKVSGDIAGVQQIVVAPDSSFNLLQDSKPNVVASVSQTKNVFRDSTYTGTLAANEVKMGTEVLGTITASGLTAGDWSGVLNFNIELK